MLFTIVLLLALSIRLWLAPMRGHVHDIEQLKIWTETAVLGNPLAIYNDSSANYPPLGLLPLIIVGHIYRLFFSPEFDTTSTTLTALIKLPAILADLATGVLLFIYLKKNHNLRWAFIGFIAYTLNPAVIYDSAWWGQLESLVALPMLLSVLAVSQGRLRWAWLWLAAAILVKPQAAVIGPVILMASIRRGSWRHLAEGLLSGAAFGLLVLLPLIIVGQLPTLIAQIRASAGRQLFLTMNAHNFWYLVTLGRGSFAAREANPILDTQPLLGPLTGWDIGLAFFLLWLVVVLIQFGRSPSPQRVISTPPPLLKNQLDQNKTIIFSDRVDRVDQLSPLPPPNPPPANNQPPLPTAFYAAALVLGFYMLPAEAHERYLFPALALLVPLLPGRRPFQIIYFLFSLTLFLNLFWVDSAVPIPSFTQNLCWGMVISAVNVILSFIFILLPIELDWASLSLAQSSNPEK